MDGITDSVDMSLSKLEELGDAQGSLVCCSPWGHKELDTTERLNGTELMVFKVLIYVPTFSSKFVFSLSLPHTHTYTHRVSQRLRKNKTHMLVYEEKEKRDKH